MRKSISSQSGIAIITVLLMVALATITVTSMSTRQYLDIRRAANQQSLQQSRSLALGGEKFAAATLMRDKNSPITGKTDSLDDDWAQALPPVPVDQSTIKGCVFDLQGRFNLNNLLHEAGQLDLDKLEQLKRLLTALNISAVKADAIADWLDKDSEPLGENGAEGSYYSGLEPPYRPGNQAMSSVSELKLVKGFSPAVEDEKADYDLLIAHVTVLPELTSININTATPEVIASLGAEFPEKAEKLSRWEDKSYEKYPQCDDIFDLSSLEKKQDSTSEPSESKEPFEKIGEFFTDAGLAGKKEVVDAISPGISVDSNFFQIRIDVSNGEIVLTQYSLVKRDKSGASTILQRSRSVF
jgi:general secretion pathway protein K